METCYKCDKTRKEVKLLDGISKGEIVKICEQCSKKDQIPVIRRPTTQQLKESEKQYAVKERLERMSGRKTKQKEVTLDDLRKKQQKPKQENGRFKLISNFNWVVSMARKRKKLTRKQLAQKIGESEAAIRMIENKKLPEQALGLINKLEQYLDIRLKKEVKENKEEKIKRQIRERYGKEKAKPELKFDKATTKSLTIDDLRKMKAEQKELDKVKDKSKSKKVNDLLKDVEVDEESIQKQQEEKAIENLKKAKQKAMRRNNMLGEVDLE